MGGGRGNGMRLRVSRNRGGESDSGVCQLRSTTINMVHISLLPIAIDCPFPFRKVCGWDSELSQQTPPSQLDDQLGTGESTILTCGGSGEVAMFQLFDLIDPEVK